MRLFLKIGFCDAKPPRKTQKRNTIASSQTLYCPTVFFDHLTRIGTYDYSQVVQYLMLFSKRRLSEGPNGLYYQNDGLRYKCIVLCHYCIIYQCLSSIATPYGPPLISKHDFPQESLLCSLLEIHPYVCKRLKIRMCVIYKSISLFLYSTSSSFIILTQLS